MSDVLIKKRTRNIHEKSKMSSSSSGDPPLPGGSNPDRPGKQSDDNEKKLDFEEGDEEMVPSSSPVPSTSFATNPDEVNPPEANPAPADAVASDDLPPVFPIEFEPNYDDEDSHGLGHILGNAYHMANDAEAATNEAGRGVTSGGGDLADYSHGNLFAGESDEDEDEVANEVTNNAGELFVDVHHGAGEPAEPDYGPAERLLREFHPSLEEPRTNSGQSTRVDTNSGPSYSNTRTTPHRERGALFPPFHHRANMSSFAETETNGPSSSTSGVSQR